MEHLDVHLRRAERHNERMALLFIDLDNFKRVNDSLGHTQGDQVLVTVADRLTAALRTSDVVGRFGGDEFVVLLPDVERIENVRVVLDALLNVVEVPVRADGRADRHALHRRGHVPRAWPQRRRADPACRHGDVWRQAPGPRRLRVLRQLAGRGHLCRAGAGERLSIGLTRGEFELFYQPQMDAKTGKLAGAGRCCAGATRRAACSRPMPSSAWPSSTA